MTVKLYVYPGENIRVDKTDALTQPVIFNADTGFEGNQNIEAPSVIIKSQSEPLYNYAFIDVYNRYYYITGKTWLSNDLWRLTMIVDPLMSFKEQIYLQRGTVIYSGKGDIKKYDPRLVYNEPIKKTITQASNATGTDGGSYWFVLTCRFSDPGSGWAPTARENQMSYLIFSSDAYKQFLANFYLLQDSVRVAISKSIVSASVVRWLDTSGFPAVDYWTGLTIPTGQYQRNASFNTPELDLDGAIGFSVPVQPTGEEHAWYPFYQISVTGYLGKQVLYFEDTAQNYQDRKAQRLIDLPYIGQINLTLEQLGVGLNIDDFYLACEISYDFGGGNYVITPGYFLKNETPSSFVPSRDCMITINNSYGAAFVTDASYQGEAETKQSEHLSMLSSAATGAVAAIMTQGKSIPASIASMGIGSANMQLTTERLQYQQAASLVMNGSTNGGSVYNSLLRLNNGVVIRPKAILIKQTAQTSTNITVFANNYGKPDGAFRDLLELRNLGYTQLGTVRLNGFEKATNSEREQIKDALLSGVIL